MTEAQATPVHPETADEEVKSKILYDLYVLMSSSTSAPELKNVQENITKILNDNGTSIETSTKFVKSNLAYPIDMSRSAYTQSVYFWADPKVIQKIRNDFATAELNLLRYLISKKEKRAPKKKERSKRTLETTLKFDQLPQERKEGAPTTSIKKEKTPATSAEENIKKIKSVEDSGDKVTLEEIDKKLDEIMENL